MNDHDPPHLQAVVFDLDGLIFNTEELYQFAGGEILRRRKKTWEPALLDAIMGRPGAIALQIMIDWHQLDATVSQLAAETEEIFKTLLDERLEMMPGVWELLAALEAAGIPRAIATSSNRAFTRRALEKFGLEPHFEFILTSEDITHGKPHPEIYLQATGRLGLPPDQVMVLEDSANGCRAAVAAGTFAVAVPGGHSQTHSFPGAQFVADTLRDSRIYRALKIEPSRRIAEYE